MRESLKVPPANLNEIYVAINSSGFSDPAYQADQFGRQPVRKIYKVLELVLKQERERINAESYTMARVGAVVQIAASMGKAQSDLADWLPYQMERPDGRPRLSGRTATILRQLIKERALPMPVIALVMDDMRSADILR